jgi:outer membrane protein assembly factor BamA
MRRSTCLALLLACGAVAPNAPAAQRPQTYLLASVTETGSSRYQSQEVVSAAGLKIGETLNTDDLKAAASRLASLGVFSNVNYSYRTREGGMSVVFTVQDAPMYRCVFDNIVWLSRQDLFQQLGLRVPLFQGYAPPGGVMIERISAALTDILAARGVHARVQLAAQAALGGPVQAIHFQEVGVPVPIKKVEFTGVAKIDPSLLHAAAQPLLGQDYDFSLVQDFSLGALADVYREHGFLRPAFGEPLASLLPLDPTPNAVAVTIPVTEGVQYLLQAITWTGQSAIPYDQLARSLHAATGQTMNAVQFEHDVLSMVLLFHPKGYLDADVKMMPALDDAAGTVSCQIQVLQGALYHMGRLEIAGLPADQSASIARISPLSPGDPYDAGDWGKFLHDAAPRLPPIQGGWKAGFRQTVNRDAKTVDVQVTFAPAASATP